MLPRKRVRDVEVDVEAIENVAKEDSPGQNEVDVNAIETDAKEEYSDEDDDTSVVPSEGDEVAVAGPGQEDSTATPGLDDDDADDDAEEDSGGDDVKVETHPDSSPPPSPKLYRSSDHPQVEQASIQLHSSPLPPDLCPQTFWLRPWSEPNSSCEAVKIKDLSCHLKLPPDKIKDTDRNVTRPPDGKCDYET